MSGTLLFRDVTLLALRLDRLRPGQLDGPVADGALARHVADEAAPEPRDLLRAARRLRDQLPDAGLPPRRERYVAAQLQALDCRARILSGETVGFADEVATCLGVRPRRTDPDRYRAAHRRLDAALPGGGSLASRLAAHRERDVVPHVRLEAAVRAVSGELRRSTRASIPLPDGERVEYEIVEGRPWTALTHHLGGGRSRVLLDAASRPRAGQLLPLLAHEAYPGHHTQHCRAERAGAALPELRLRLVHSPQGLLAEGAAENAHLVLPGPGWGRTAERVLAGIGVELDGGLAEAVETELDGLGRVRQDAALLRHVDGVGPDEVAAHLSRWLLIDDSRARRMLGFLDHPHWRTYTTAYAEGGPLVAAWLAHCGTDPVAGLRRLLDEPLTPEDLTVELGRTPDPAPLSGGVGLHTG